MAKAKDKFGNGMVYEQFGDVYKPEIETGICPVCKTLWNSHNEQELERCRKIKKLETKTKYPENCLACNKKLDYKGVGRRKMFCGYACKYNYKKSHSELTCPSCHSKNIGLDGHYKGQQKYRCKDCKRKFQERYKVKAFLNMRLSSEQKMDNSKKHSLYHTIYGENLEVLTEKNVVLRKRGLLRNPLCYKCMKHTHKSYKLKGNNVYFCPRCKLRFIKMKGEQ